MPRDIEPPESEHTGLVDSKNLLARGARSVGTSKPLIMSASCRLHVLKLHEF